MRNFFEKDFSYLKDIDDNVVAVKIINGLKSNLKNLPSSAQYKVNIQAVVVIDEVDKVTNQTQKVSHTSLPASITCHTAPKPPVSLRLVNVGYTDVSITWSPPPTTGKGETIKEYLVRYVTMDTNGSRIMVGTEKIQSALTKTNVNITGLAMGFMYGFSVKVRIYFILININIRII